MWEAVVGVHKVIRFVRLFVKDLVMKKTKRWKRKLLCIFFRYSLLPVLDSVERKSDLQKDTLKKTKKNIQCGGESERNTTWIDRNV